MLTIASSSSCDVCLENFDDTSKAPCSIECGHVFCLDCLNQISRPNCPLCRSQIELRTYVRLHIDIDRNSSLSRPDDERLRAEPVAQEARRLQAAIADVVDKGITEPLLKQLISDCRGFLAKQQAGVFPELRVSFRMIAYLYEVKTRLRSQMGQVDALKMELTQLQTERDDLRRNVSVLEAEIKEERKERRYILEQSIETQKYASGLMQFLTNLMHNPEEMEKCRSKFQAGFPIFPSNCEQTYSQETNSSEKRPDPQFLISPLPEFDTGLPSSFATVDPEPQSQMSSPRSPSLPEFQSSELVGKRSMLSLTAPRYEPSTPSSSRHNQSPSSPAVDLPSSGQPSYRVDHTPMQNRLREILGEDPHGLVSSSLPNLGSRHIPERHSRERERSTSRTRTSSTGSSRSQKELSYPGPSSAPPVIGITHTTAVSHASTAAALQRERNKKEKTRIADNDNLYRPTLSRSNTQPPVMTSAPIFDPSTQRLASNVHHSTYSASFGRKSTKPAGNELHSISSQGLFV